MSKKRTKKYTPRPVINPLDILSQRSHERIAPEQNIQLGIAYFSALDGMTKPSANEEMWSNLVLALDTSLLLCQGGFLPEMTRTIDSALDGMVIVQNRARNGYGWQLGNHYDTVRAGCEVHRRHLETLPKHILTKTLHEVMRRTGNLQAVERLAA